MSPAVLVRAAAITTALAVLAAACGGSVDQTAPPPDSAGSNAPRSSAPEPAATGSGASEPPTPPASPVAALPAGVIAPPVWLGTRILPLRADGFGEIQPTPAELTDRRLASRDLLAPPADDGFVASVGPVPPEVVARSTWQPECPVTLDQLAYLTVSYRGFDGLAHTGELMVAAEVADDIVTVFRGLYDAGFPIEEMRVPRADELDEPPTGDGNNTAAFVCRPATGQARWSQHAFGLALDVNPFHNPYDKAGLVVPELASSYLDREDQRPGMIAPDDVVVAAFAAIGWSWGGAWRSLEDYQHFSANGR